MKRCHVVVLVLAAALTVATSAAAQQVAAQSTSPRFPVRGTVQDQTGGMLGTANVTLTVCEEPAAK